MPEEKERYEQSLKYHRDLKNVIDTSFEEGKIEIAQKAIQKGMSLDTIIQLTGLSKEEIKKIVR